MFPPVHAYLSRALRHATARLTHAGCVASADWLPDWANPGRRPVRVEQHTRLVVWGFQRHDHQTGMRSTGCKDHLSRRSRKRATATSRAALLTPIVQTVRILAFMSLGSPPMVIRTMHRQATATHSGAIRPAPLGA